MSNTNCLRPSSGLFLNLRVRIVKSPIVTWCCLSSRTCVLHKVDYVFAVLSQ